MFFATYLRKLLVNTKNDRDRNRPIFRRSHRTSPRLFDTNGVELYGFVTFTFRMRFASERDCVETYLGED